MAESTYGSGPVPLYAVTVQQAMIGGDLAKMREVCARAEKHVADHGNVGAAIAKAEGKHG